MVTFLDDANRASTRVTSALAVAVTYPSEDQDEAEEFMDELREVAERYPNIMLHL